MAAKGKTRFNTPRVKAILGEVNQEIGEELAFDIEARIKTNINNEPSAGHTGLIDTGFMLNSVYVVLPESDTYAAADPSGVYIDREGLLVQRSLAPRIALPGDAAALVAVGAEYTIYLEEEHSFIQRAVERSAKGLDAIVEGTTKFHD
jgi:hypothetical protein